MPPPSRIIVALRRQLAAEIVRSLGPGSAYSIAPSYGVRQPRMSELERGVVDRCSVEWLIRRIERMGGTVQVTVTLGDAGRKWHTDRARRFRMGVTDALVPTTHGPTDARALGPLSAPLLSTLIPNLE